MDYSGRGERSTLVPHKSSGTTRFSTLSTAALLGMCAIAFAVCFAISTAASNETSISHQLFHRITPSTLLLFGSPPHSASPCGTLSNVVFSDMHDGDQKVLSLRGDQLRIEPAPSSSSSDEESWIIQARVDLTTCSAMVDFDVPGKPSPPPVPLLATIWSMETLAGTHPKLTLEFTDPSETIAPSKTDPLNHWVQLGPS